MPHKRDIASEIIAPTNPLANVGTALVKERKRRTQPPPTGETTTPGDPEKENNDDQNENSYAWMIPLVTMAGGLGVIFYYLSKTL